ncbi:MAG: hypothetical protein OQL16_07315 [Gammaproteobacteria bacterium]|nr:hypothetical protein [Gammaproteobacteria bacterium]
MTTKENSGQSVASNKQVKQQSADDSSTAVVMEHQAYAATTGPIDIEAPAAEGTEQQADVKTTAPTDSGQPASGTMEHQAYTAISPPVDLKPSTAGSITHLYAPYLIAISFIAMTGLLTLLLSAVMDNKVELDRVAAIHDSKPILADARMAFGQESTPITETEQVGLPALLSEEAAVSPDSVNHSATSENQISVAAENTDEVPQAVNTANNLLPLENEPALASDQPDSVTAPITTIDEVTTVSVNSADGNLSAVDKTTQTVHSDMIDENANSQTSPTVATATLAEENIVSTSETLDRVIDTHDQRIKEIHTAILEQSYDSRQSVEQTITNQLKLMEMQVRNFEEGIRPSYPPAIAAYERMINRRRASFHRMMQNREELLQRVHNSHKRLRERYSQLLDMLDQEIPGIV